MIKYYKGDIFEAPIDILIHQANCYCTFGSGIALEIKKRFPEAYEADCKTKKSDLGKLGKFSFARVNEPKTRIKYIFNMYSQGGVSATQRMTSYDAMVMSLTSIKDKIETAKKENLVVGVPYKIGCGLGGGDFTIVKAILDSVFLDSPITCLICKRDCDD